MKDRNKVLKGVVFDIQRYSIHDGPGIRTTVFLKGCPLRCYWCQNPESQRKEPEVLLFKDKCTLCGQCVAVCPSGASSLSATSSVIDRSKCLGCGKCVEACLNEARKLAGEYKTVDEVMEEVHKDMNFYKNSGGGVTLSGGDPVAQPAFALAILKECKEAGLHTVIDTCGYTRWPTLNKLLEYTDMVLFDIKHLDSGEHKRTTGVGNGLILENLKKTSAMKPVWLRMPLIAGFNDSESHVIQLIELGERTNAQKISLLPYHEGGRTKCEQLGRPYPFSDAKAPEKEHIEHLKKMIQEKGITAAIGH